ncbi:RNA-binding protein 39 [Sesamum angolense]|uniref:RNA-binding protein 39 n=1 Tax=Sesamum angolense TaxID=2727404 RepID=A0AAE1WXB2_9LAMI|nr:RNA-binding protein 39 [Sesamum angolense]
MKYDVMILLQVIAEFLLSYLVPSFHRMDFDEYEYLENTVENPELKKLEDKANEVVEYEEKDRSRNSKHRGDDDADDLERLSKRSRSRKESHDHDKDRSSRYGSSSRDREKGERDRHVSNREHRDRDKEHGSGKERNRDRDRDREKERDSDKKGVGNRERRERESERERNREEERERSKRSRSYSERNHDEQGREKTRDMEIIDSDFKERRREREFGDRGHESSGVNFKNALRLNEWVSEIALVTMSDDFKMICDSRVPQKTWYPLREEITVVYMCSLLSGKIQRKKEDAVEPEADPERDQRTVFAYQITLKAGERDVYEFFSRAGKPLLGQPVMVKPSEAEKNLVQSTSGGGGLTGPYSGGARVLYVGNLPVAIKEDQLRQIHTFLFWCRFLNLFGTVELVQMPSEPGTGNCKGYAFIQVNFVFSVISDSVRLVDGFCLYSWLLQFARLEDAKAAQNLNGQLEIAGRVIKVSAVTDQVGMQDAGANIADFDDDDGTGLSLNAHSRALLMQKLDRTGTASSFTDSSAAAVLGQISVPVLPGLAGAALSIPALTGPPMDTIGAPSECLLLKNMFDPSSEAEPDFDLDIKEDVQDECSKFGRLKHIYVEKNSAGFVYLRFENAESAIAAQRALHGRWFAGKMITATFMLHHDYEAKFPDSSG